MPITFNIQLLTESRLISLHTVTTYKHSCRGLTVIRTGVKSIYRPTNIMQWLNYVGNQGKHKLFEIKTSRWTPSTDVWGWAKILNPKKRKMEYNFFKHKTIKIVGKKIQILGTCRKEWGTYIVCDFSSLFFCRIWENRPAFGKL